MALPFDEAVRKNLAAIIGAYRKATGAEVSQISKRFYGQSAFLGRFLAGEATITTPKLRAVLVAFGEAWPVGVPWPAIEPTSMGRPPRAPRAKAVEKEKLSPTP